MHGYIYLITNKISGRAYVGRRVNKKGIPYYKDGYFGSGKALKDAIKSYGKENFKKQYLEFIWTNNKDLSHREMYWIEKLQHKNLYNLTKGGDGFKGKHPKSYFLKVRERAYLNLAIHFSEVERLYVNKRKTLKEIEKIVNLHHKTIAKILQLLDIPRRYKADYTRLTEEQILQKKISKRIPKHLKKKRIFSVEDRETIRQDQKGNNHRGRVENIEQLTLDGKLIRLWRDSKEIVDYFKLKNASSVLRVLRGERKKYKNSLWRLKNNDR